MPRCGSCGEIGHRRNSKKCKNYDSYVPRRSKKRMNNQQTSDPENIRNPNHSNIYQEDLGEKPTNDDSRRMITSYDNSDAEEPIRVSRKSKRARKSSMPGPFQAPPQQPTLGPTVTMEKYLSMNFSRNWEKQRADREKQRGDRKKQLADFYYNKLRAIEKFLDDIKPRSDDEEDKSDGNSKDPVDQIPNGNTMADKIREMLYADRAIEEELSSFSATSVDSSALE